MFVQPVGTIWPSWVSGAGQDIVIVADDNDVGGVAASSAFCVVRVNGAPFESGDGIWGGDVSLLSRDRKRRLTFDETRLVQCVGMNVALSSFDKALGDNTGSASRRELTCTSWSSQTVRQQSMAAGVQPQSLNSGCDVSPAKKKTSPRKA